MVLLNQTERHCLKVLKVYDWITRPINLQIKKVLEERQKLVTDKVCGNIGISCGETSLVWEASADLSVSGSVTVFHDTGCEQMEVIVNGRTAFLLTRGQSQSMTFQRLRSVEVRCIGDNGFCIGKYCLTLHYKLSTNCFEPGYCQLICFLSDECGKPTDSLRCQEIPQSEGRKRVEVFLPDGNTVFLQKVKMLKKGFVTIKVLNMGQILCTLCTIPFQIAEKLFLCAPPGTFIECEITDFECEVQFTEDCKTILVSISFCQNVQVVANVKIEMNASPCLPRSEIDINPCIPSPVNCDLRFPVKEKTLL